MATWHPFACVLLLATVCVQATPTHLCAKIALGDFASISLKSITHYGPNRLVIFEGKHKYNVALSAVKRYSLPLDASYKFWDADEMAVAIEQMELGTDEPLAVYMFAFGNPEAAWHQNVMHLGRKKLALNVVTPEAEYMWNIWNWESPEKMWQTQPRVHTDYAVVANQSEKKPRGFVVQKDVITGTPTFIIHDLVFRKTGGLLSKISVHLDIYQNDTEHFPDAAYYHLEVTEHPNKVRLVHRANYASPRPGDAARRSLFTQLPVGFLLGSSVLLFDSDLGCVNIIENIPTPLATAFKDTKKADLLLSRKTIPYENFFKCPAEFKQAANFYERHSRHRCQTTLSDRVKMLDTAEDEGQTDIALGSKLAIIFGLLIGLLVGFFVIIIVVIKLKMTREESVAVKGKGKKGKAKSSVLGEKIQSKATPTPPAGKNSLWRKVLRQVNKALKNPISVVTDESRSFRSASDLNSKKLTTTGVSSRQTTPGVLTKSPVKVSPPNVLLLEEVSSGQEVSSSKVSPEISKSAF